MKSLLVLSSVRPLPTPATVPPGARTRGFARSGARPLAGKGVASRVWRLPPPSPPEPSVAATAPRKGTAAPAAEPPAPALVRECWEIPVLYEDDHLLALGKPPLLLTSPDRETPEQPSLMRLLHEEIARGAGWARERGLTYLANAHRLELETSGLILLAKTKPTLVALADLFGSFQPVQTFLALVHGAPRETEFEIDAKLAPQPHRPRCLRVDERHGKLSRTRFKVRESFRGHTLLECIPLTSRPHQIRVHLRCAHLALVADPLYGGPPLWLSEIKPRFRLKEGHQEKPLLGRVALHSERMMFRHPVTGADVRIEAPWPRDLAVAIKYLRRYSASTPPPDPAGSPAGNGTEPA